MIFEYDDTKIIKLKDCDYPRCELCTEFEDGYCTVPVILNKQKYRELETEIEKMKNDIKELDKALYDEILGVKREPKTPLYETVTANGGEYGLPDNYYGVEETLLYQAGDSVEQKDGTKINFKWEKFE